ncbi:hypothetical protein BC830DRAFT_1174170 [Chytriomyces sp. MP71]|nr:hypothetical protein BC830DRAFT_1174170 [Chytriomyces sp. MP71]
MSENATHDAPADTPFVASLAHKMAATLTRIVYEMDMKAVAVQASQAELIKEMDRLTAELHAVLAAADDPPPVDPLIQRLLVCRKRLMTANNSLAVSKERLSRVRGLLIAGSSTGGR